MILILNILGFESSIQNFTSVDPSGSERIFYFNIQDGWGISSIIVTDDYLCYKEPESPYHSFIFFFSYFNI